MGDQWELCIQGDVWGVGGAMGGMGDQWVRGTSKSKSKKTLFNVGQCKQYNISSQGGNEMGDQWELCIQVTLGD